MERTSLPWASTSLELLLVAVDTLLRRAYARPEIRGRYAGKVVLECSVCRAAPWQKTVAFQEGVNRWERASFIVRSRLEAEPPEVPIDDLTLTLADFTGESGAQLGLLPDATGSPAAATGGDRTAVADSVRRRLGLVPGGQRGSLASGPGDAGGAGAPGPSGNRRHPSLCSRRSR